MHSASQVCRMTHSSYLVSRDQIIQPMGVTAEGRLAPLYSKMRGFTEEEEEEDSEEEEEEILDMKAEMRKDKQMD